MPQAQVGAPKDKQTEFQERAPAVSRESDLGTHPTLYPYSCKLAEKAIEIEYGIFNFDDKEKLLSNLRAIVKDVSQKVRKAQEKGASPEQILETINTALQKWVDVVEVQNRLSDGLRSLSIEDTNGKITEKAKLDCDTLSLVYLDIAQECNLPLKMISPNPFKEVVTPLGFPMAFGLHAAILWGDSKGVIPFETTSTLSFGMLSSLEVGKLVLAACEDDKSRFYRKSGLAESEIEALVYFACVKYSEAIQKAENFSFAYLRRGFLYIQSNEFEKARQDFLKARQIDPSSVPSEMDLSTTENFIKQVPESMRK